MTQVFVAPTATGVLLTRQNKLPFVELPDGCSLESLLGAVAAKYGADLGCLIPVGSYRNLRIIAVGEVHAQGSLYSLKCEDNLINLLTALVRNGLSDWRLDGEGDDFGIKFLGS